jgi:hypothetical protein
MPADFGVGRPVERYIAASPTSEIDLGIVGLVGPNRPHRDSVFTGRQWRKLIASIGARDTEGLVAIRLPSCRNLRVRDDLRAE